MPHFYLNFHMTNIICLMYSDLLFNPITFVIFMMYIVVRISFLTDGLKIAAFSLWRSWRCQNYCWCNYWERRGNFCKHVFLSLFLFFMQAFIGGCIVLSLQTALRGYFLWFILLLSYGHPSLCSHAISSCDIPLLHRCFLIFIFRM